MAMTVVNNPSAVMTLGELNKNVSKLGKQLSKLASGQKIVSAGDGTADYSISERMQAQIRSLRQDIDNTRTGRSMLKVAEGGIQGIVDELREMKKMAINAANDSNTDADRATIQKEFDEKLKQIDDIVATTHYNGKLLLNGEYGRGWGYTSVEGIRGHNVSGGASSIGDGTGSVSTGVSEPTGISITLASGNHIINSDGVYELEVGFTGDITIADGVSGVKIKQATSEQLTEVHINGPATGNANLWIEGLNVNNTTDQSWIRFYGNDNVLSIKGHNALVSGTSGYKTYDNALINIGDGLTIEGSGSLEISGWSSSGAMIGSDMYENSHANLIINSGTYILTDAVQRGTKLRSWQSGSYAAIIGAGREGSIGDITVNGGSFDLFSCSGGANLGSGTAATAGDIIIKNANFVGLADSGACIGSGGAGSVVGNITIEDSVIRVESTRVMSDSVSNHWHSGSGAGIGSGMFSNAGDITIRNTTIYAYSNEGAGVGSGFNGDVGNITIENVTGEVMSQLGENFGKGLEGSAGTVDIDGFTEKSDSTDDQYKNVASGNPLIIHTGTKANQRINCYIEDLGTKALFNVKTDEELAELANVCNRASAQRLLGDIADPSVDGPLDKAINYALNEMTQVGSYINRLEQTEDTLTISHENTTSSESTIRDADMAKEMMEYTKSNVLTQAAQSMLAQANQNSSSVLSLLQ